MEAAATAVEERVAEGMVEGEKGVVAMAVETVAAPVAVMAAAAMAEAVMAVAVMVVGVMAARWSGCRYECHQC